MKQSIDEDPTDPIDDEAARWAARAISGDFSDEDEKCMRRWANGDPRRRLALEDYMALADVASAARSVEVIPVADSPARSFAPRRSRWFAMAPAIAAGLCALVLAPAVLRESPRAPVRYETARGEIETIALPDGSSVALDAASAVEITYERDARRARLVSGEAVFTVRANEERPFTVEAGALNARVLGTEFSVTRGNEAATVEVLSGVVAVEAPGQIDVVDDIRLVAGERAARTLGGAIAIEDFDAAAAAAWRRGTVSYQGETLDHVLVDLNRYFTNDFVIGDSGLAAIPITGEFDLNDRDRVARRLALALNLRTERRDDGAIALYARD